jgi:hypothetical protein
LASFRSIARIALVTATVCVTVGASGVLATMTWQVPGDANAAVEGGSVRGTSSSLIITAAYTYIDSQTARMAALQAATVRTASPTAAKAAREKDVASFAPFERKCLKKVSKRRNAKLVHVSCSPLQAEFGETVAAAETTASPLRKTARRTPAGAFARQVE